MSHELEIDGPRDQEGSVGNVDKTTLAFFWCRTIAGGGINK